MATFPEDHELHKRRYGRNLGLGLTLLAYVGLVFGLTIVKVSNGATVQDFDHRLPPGVSPSEVSN
jgi:hypothetical protein